MNKKQLRKEELAREISLEEEGKNLKLSNVIFEETFLNWQGMCDAARRVGTVWIYFKG